MGTKLTYPKLPSGYRWNIRQKIRLKTGYWCGSYTNANGTYFMFQEDLTPQEEADVDALIGDGSTCQDSVKFVSANNRIIIKCIPEWLPELEAEAGFNIALTYDLSGSKGTNPGHPDEIVLQAVDPTYQMEKLLTGNEPKKFMDAVKNLSRVE
jgi:hypothetical protein